MFRIERLSTHSRQGFDCGNEALNDWFLRRSSQDVRRQATNCFVAVEEENSNVAGFYTLSACHIFLDDRVADLQIGLPRYPQVPAVLLGRLAVSNALQGQRLGAALQGDAIRRCRLSDIAAAFMVVKAKDETVASFYRRYGFLSDPSEDLRLVLRLR